MKLITKIVSLTVLSLTVCSGLKAQYAIRPGSDLPELKLKRSALRAPGRDGLPDYIDNSKSPYFPSIISQYGGSCAQASGIHYLFTYEVNRMLERPVQGKPANTFSYRWIWNLLNEGKDQGGFSSDGIDITKVAGCMNVADFGDESAYDYRWPNGYDKYYRAMFYKTKKSSTVNLSTMDGINTLMSYMYDKQDGHPGGGIAVFSISSDNWGYEDYSGPSETGYEEIINMKGDGGAHAMTLVGYDLTVEYDCNGDSVITDDERGAFILVNSWGTWWGSEGRAYIPFKYFIGAGYNDSMTSWDAQALCIETEYKQPVIGLKLKLSYSSRNDLVIRFGAADGYQATKTDKGASLSYPIMQAQGGDQNMQGTMFAGGQTIEMGFDLSPLKEVTDKMKSPNFLIILAKTVLGKSGTGHLMEATVYDYANDTTYLKTFSEEEKGIKVGYKLIKIPTKPWYKNKYDVWYEPCYTTSNLLMQPADYTKEPDWKDRYFAVRKAHGGFATLKVTDYNPKTHKITLDIMHYE
ncbi:MAG: hypothetical protein IKX55_03455 [Bacteroidaceae bacterium]|nr:hypothetical protein [Bacteroidaceae bacterium]